MLPPSAPRRLALTADVSATCAETSRGVRIPLCYAEALSMTSWTRTGQQGPPQRCLASRIIRGSRRSAEDVGSTVVLHCILTAHATALLHAEATPSRAPHVRSSKTDGLAVSTFLRGSEVTVIELEDKLPSTELSAQALAPDCLMAAGFQVFRCRRGHLVLKLDVQPVAKAPARRIRSRLEILTVVRKPDHDLRVSLRLDRATHNTETHQGPSALRDERRDDRVKWPFPRPDHIGMTRP